MIIATLAWLSGCGGPPPDPYAEVEDPLERQCLQAHCDAPEDPEACRRDHCAWHEATWSLEPKSIRYDGQVAFVEAAVGHDPAGYGDVVEPRREPVYVGVTLIRESGEEIDLAVQTRFEDDIESPFFVSADVGAGVEYVILGLWDHKVEPCESERPGCREFGFLLDGSLASWPPTIYVDGRRQRIPPDPVTLGILAAGGAPVAVDRARSVASSALARELALFDVGHQVSVSLAGAPDDALAVRYAHPGDALVASRVAAALGPDVTWTPDPKAGAAVEVIVGGPHHACQVEHCAGAGDLAACHAEHCE